MRPVDRLMVNVTDFNALHFGPSSSRQRKRRRGGIKGRSEGSIAQGERAEGSKCLIQQFLIVTSGLETVSMSKRNLRVVKWLGTVPAIGVCTFCNRQFKVPITAMKRVADAQQALRLQFAGHDCKGEGEIRATPTDF
jgi:hypothetical protein